RSTPPMTSHPDAALTARTSSRPIRPAAPMTAIFKSLIFVSSRTGTCRAYSRAGRGLERRSGSGRRWRLLLVTRDGLANELACFLVVAPVIEPHPLGRLEILVVLEKMRDLPDEAFG